MVLVHGGGYVGLIGAVHFALAGHNVVIYDPDPIVADAINLGRPRAQELVGYMAGPTREAIDSGRLVATSAPSNRDTFMARADVHVVAVPTERAGEPMLAILDAVILDIAARARDGALLVVESTLTPGTTRRLRPLVEARGRRLGESSVGGLRWAVAPRRDWLADSGRNVVTLARVVGGVTPDCTAAAIAFLRTVSNKIHATDAATAEVVKALENALLHVPVMFAHQLAAALPELDIAEALRLAATHWRLPEYHLNIGTGGRCVSLGTKYLYTASRQAPELTLARAAIEADRGFSAVVAEAIAARIPAGGRVAVLGIGYRPGFRDRGESPGLRAAAACRDRGFEVRVHDPLYGGAEIAMLDGCRWEPLELKVGAGGGAGLEWGDAVVLATPHDEYLTLPAKARWRPGQFVLDAQGEWAPFRQFLAAAGVRYVAVGEPGWRGEHA